MKGGIGIRVSSAFAMAALCMSCSCERGTFEREGQTERMRTTSEYEVAQNERLNTGFFMDIGSDQALKVAELVGKTRNDPWRGLVIRTSNGKPAKVELESRFPTTVWCGGNLRSMPEGRIALSLSSKDSAVVLTRLTQAEVGPRVDRTKFSVGVCYGFPRTHPPSERDADYLVEGNVNSCGIGHFGSKEILAWLAKRNITCSVRDVRRWWGGDGDRAGKMQESWPLARFDKLIDAVREIDSQTLAMSDICDEPSALDMPYLGDVVAHWINRYPKVLPYVNLYPNYAKVSWTTGDQRVNQLGTTNYFAHVERYCQTVPLDYICIDHYPFDDSPEKTRKRESGWYQNFEDAAYWCRKTGRDLWFIGQVNTKPGRVRWLTENNFRFQVNTALAYGTVKFDWATWQHAWWTNSVIHADGTPTQHFEKVKRINAELLRLAPEYMRYRNVATKLLNFPKRGNVATFSNEVCTDLRTADGSKLVVGDMVARDGGEGRALYVFAADDMPDVKRQFRTVRFRTSQTMRVADGQGELPVSRALDGSLSFRLRDCHGALVTFAVSGCRASEQRFDHSKLLVGAYCYRPCGSDEEHVRDVARCGVDFIIGVDVKAREVLDLFSKYHLGAVANGAVPSWWGGDGKSAGKMHVKCPRDAYERRLTEYVATLDHPAIWKIDLCDEPSAKDMPYIGETCELIARRVPQAQAYVNLYPNYAVASKNTGAEEVGQLGAKTYREYVETYCRTVPLDFISYDFYVYTQNRQRRPRLLAQMYDNFNIVAEACRRTGRSLWYVPQVNSHNAKDFEPTSVNRLRFQAYTAMAYGAEAITWACWMPGWWTNNVYTADGRKTEQYEKLRKVNAEIHRFGPDYMAFRSAATHFVGFESGAEMAKLGVSLLETLDAGCFRGISTRERTPLLVGEMLPRGKDDGRRAIFVVASGDPYDYAPAKRTVVFRLSDGRRVRILGTDGEISARREGESAWSFELDENSAALVVAGIRD